MFSDTPANGHGNDWAGNPAGTTTVANSQHLQHPHQPAPSSIQSFYQSQPQHQQPQSSGSPPMLSVAPAPFQPQHRQATNGAQQPPQPIHTLFQQQSFPMNVNYSTQSNHSHSHSHSHPSLGSQQHPSQQQQQQQSHMNLNFNPTDGQSHALSSYNLSNILSAIPATNATAAVFNSQRGTSGGNNYYQYNPSNPAIASTNFSQSAAASPLLQTQSLSSHNHNHNVEQTSQHIHGHVPNMPLTNLGLANLGNLNANVNYLNGQSSGQQQPLTQHQHQSPFKAVTASASSSLTVPTTAHIIDSSTHTRPARGAAPKVRATGVAGVPVTLGPHQPPVASALSVDYSAQSTVPSSSSSLKATKPRSSRPSAQPHSPFPLIHTQNKKPYATLLFHCQRRMLPSSMSAKSGYENLASITDEMVAIKVRVMVAASAATETVPALLSTELPSLDSLYFVAADISAIIHSRKSNIAKAVSSFPDQEKGRMSILCAQANGTVSTHSLTVLSLSGVKRLLNFSCAPISLPFREWIEEKVHLLTTKKDFETQEYSDGADASAKMSAKAEKTTTTQLESS